MTIKERTLILIKPEGVTRGLIGEIIQRIEQLDLKIIGLGVVQASSDQIDKHYPSDLAWIKLVGEKTLGTYKQYEIDPLVELGTSDPEAIGKLVRGWLITHMTSGPIIKMAIEGTHAISALRKLAGPTKPYEAPPGTIRGDFSTDSPVAGNMYRRPMLNIIHASENAEEAARELAHWFRAEELVDSKW